MSSNSIAGSFFVGYNKELYHVISEMQPGFWLMEVYSGIGNEKKCRKIWPLQRIQGFELYGSIAELAAHVFAVIQAQETSGGKPVSNEAEIGGGK